MIIVICLVLISMVLFGTERTNAQTPKRIGTFDSRAVAIVYYNSKDFKNLMESLKSEMKTAKEKDDKKAMAKIEREGSLRQVMAHEQGFGTGSISSIIETVKDKIAVLAKNENLTAIVSKWELTYNSPDVELIDVTEKIAAFFEPNDRMKEMIKEVLKSEPVKDAYLIED
jgi:hypothetical protein